MLQLGQLVTPRALDAMIARDFIRIGQQVQRGELTVEQAQPLLHELLHLQARWLPLEVGEVVEVTGKDDKYDALVRFSAGQQCVGDAITMQCIPDAWTREYFFTEEELEVCTTTS